VGLFKELCFARDGTSGTVVKKVSYGYALDVGDAIAGRHPRVYYLRNGKMLPAAALCTAAPCSATSIEERGGGGLYVYYFLI
jgi:hypothetical protein